MPCVKRNIGKQCRPRSDAAERGIWSGSTLFALTLERFNNKSNYAISIHRPLWLYNGPGRRSWWEISLKIFRHKWVKKKKTKKMCELCSSNPLHFHSIKMAKTWGKIFWAAKSVNTPSDMCAKHSCGLIKIFTELILDSQWCKISSSGQQNCIYYLFIYSLIHF